MQACKVVNQSSGEDLGSRSHQTLYMGRIHGDLVKAQECIQQLGKALAFLAQKIEPAQIKHTLKEAAGLRQAFVHFFREGAIQVSQMHQAKH